MFNINLSKLSKELIICSTLLVYLLFLKVVFLPYYLILPLLLLGFTVFTIKTLNGKIERKYLQYFLLIFLICLWSFVCLTINYSYDLYFLKEFVLLNLIYFFSAFGVKRVFYYLKVEYNVKNITLFLIIAVVAQLLVSILINLLPSLFRIVYSIFSLDSTKGLDYLEANAERRLVGFGVSFFGAGVLYSYTLIVIAFYMRNFAVKKHLLLMLLLYSFVLFTGLLFSRTTIVGFIASLLLLMNFKVIKHSLLFLIAGIVALFFIPIDFLLSNKYIAFGIDFLIDFDNSNAASSVEGMLNMYSTLPENLNTWIFGDSRYKIVNSAGQASSYYKNVDIGYLRLIFHNGVIGLLLYMIFHFFLIFKSLKLQKFSIALFVCLLVLNAKGIASIGSIIFLYFIIDNNHKTISNYSNNQRYIKSVL